METYKEFYKTICRVCLKTDQCEKMVSLLDNSSENGLSCYGQSVLVFAKVNLKREYLPSSICKSCIQLLKQAIIFKKTCEKSDEILSNFVKKNIGSESSLMQVVSDFAMFKHYFRDINIEQNPTRVTEMRHRANSTDSESVMSREFKYEINIDVDHSNDYSDHRSEEETKEITPGPEQDVDTLLESMEKVINLDPQVLNKCLRKEKKINNNDVSKKIKRQRQLQKIQMKQKIKMKKRKLNQMNRKNIPCPVCNKVLANLYTYKAHMQSHDGWKYVCDLCAKGFPIYCYLKMHQASVHKIGRLYQCSKCDFKAARHWDLTEHERFHTGERPYACDKCGLTFRRRYIWKRHATYHNEKTVQCPKCPRKFHRQGEMLAHSNNVHDRVYVYGCSQCEITYAKSSSVRKHLIERHGIPKEEQGKIAKIIIGSSTFGKE